MAARLAGRLGADQLEAGQPDSEKEGRDEGTCCANQRTECSRARADDRESRPSGNALGVEAEEQPTLSPGRDDHETADREPQRIGVQVLREGNGKHPGW